MALDRTHDHTVTKLHQIASPGIVFHIKLIAEWRALPYVAYINAVNADCEMGIIVVLNAVAAEGIHYLD